MVGSSVGVWLGTGVGSTVGACVVGASVGGGTQGAEVTPGESVPEDASDELSARSLPESRNALPIWAIFEDVQLVRAQRTSLQVSNIRRVSTQAVSMIDAKVLLEAQWLTSEETSAICLSSSATHARGSFLAAASDRSCLIVGAVGSAASDER